MQKSGRSVENPRSLSNAKSELFDTFSALEPQAEVFAIFVSGYFRRRMRAIIMIGWLVLAHFPTHEALCMGAALTGTRATRTRATLASLALRSTSTRPHSSPLQADGLNILVFQGSTRTDGPPSPACVGRRVALWVQTALTARKHAVQVVDPLEGPLIKPHFAYPQGRAPQQLEELAVLIKAADAFVMVTPEYNHAPSPALLNTLNHFGSSLFSFKPSAIVSYSQGQWYCTTIFQYIKDISDKINMNIDTHVFHYTTCPTAKGH
jgi:NAD(P)H-dependent FMN reductase